MAFWKRRNKVRNLVLNHLACVRTAILSFQAASIAFFQEGDFEKASTLACEINRAEGNADEIRRQVASVLVSGALLPAARRQVLELVEHVDSLANAAEATLDQLTVQQVEVPPEVVTSALEIVEETVLIWHQVESAVQLLFVNDAAGVLKCAERIELAEARVDRIERDLLKDIFRSDLDLSHKLQISEVMKDLVKISDRAEDLADRLALIVAERAY